MTATKTRPARKSGRRRTMPIPRSKPAARVAVAKDVIKRLQYGKLHAQTHYYVVNTTGKATKPDVDNIEANCGVCAMGACMLSFARLYNHIDLEDAAEHTKEFEDHYNFTKFRSVLLRVFTGVQLQLIETAFECDDFTDSRYDYSGIKTVPVLNAIKFGESFRRADDRMLAIMQNIVDHKGTFRPEVAYEIISK